ncbi:MAG: hypothetical protein JOZ51_22695 [Chloroflexi bacterium]|nr:hypothetical protein [Chloroflexota bacterium]
MLIGTHDATLRQVQRVDLHGTHFYDLIFEHLATPGELRRARVSAESIYAEPQPGDAIRVSYLMNVVASVEQRTHE